MLKIMVGGLIQSVVKLVTCYICLYTTIRLDSHMLSDIYRVCALVSTVVVIELQVGHLQAFATLHGH